MGLLFLASNFISIYLGFSWQASSRITRDNAIATTTTTSEIGLRTSAAAAEEEEDEDVKRLLITHLNLTEIELQEVRYEASQLRQELEAAQELVRTLLEQSLSSDNRLRPIGTDRRDGDGGGDDDDDDINDADRSDRVEADDKVGANEDDVGIF
jgi:hypothetical protein